MKHHEGEDRDAFVTVRVSRELMTMLQSGWSDPVRIMIADNPNANHVEMIAIKHECEKSE